MLRVSAIALLLASPSWQPRPPEPLTVWAEAGSRPWGQCRELERTAEAMVVRQSIGIEGPSQWAERVRPDSAGDVGLVREISGLAGRDLMPGPRGRPRSSGNTAILVAGSGASAG